MDADVGAGHVFVVGGRRREAADWSGRGSCAAEGHVAVRRGPVWALTLSCLSASRLSPSPSSSPRRPPRPPHSPLHPLSCSRDDIMTLPANDAFTLGFPHDPARIGLRSSSKIPFVSGSKPPSPSTAPRRSVPPRQMTVDLPDSPSHPDSRSPLPHPNSISHSFPSSNGSPNGAPLRHRKKPRTTSALPSSPSQLLPNRTAQKSPRPPVDWEIPRKTLHSSIGMSLLA